MPTSTPITVEMLISALQKLPPTYVVALHVGGQPHLLHRVARDDEQAQAVLIPTPL